jgi:hypothetical protein
MGDRQLKTSHGAIASGEAIQLLDTGKGRTGAPQTVGLHDAIDSNISTEIMGPSPGVLRRGSSRVRLT